MQTYTITFHWYDDPQCIETVVVTGVLETACRIWDHLQLDGHVMLTARPT